MYVCVCARARVAVGLCCLCLCLCQFCVCERVCAAIAKLQLRECAAMTYVLYKIAMCVYWLYTARLEKFL